MRKLIYSIETIHNLESIFSLQNLHRPIRIQRYDPGTELTYAIQGVFPALKGKATLRIEKFVGGGFAGQVYKVKILYVDIPGGNIPGLTEGQDYALKILIPKSAFVRWFRSFMYGIAFQGPYSLQVNPDAARAGALWQKFIRRGAKLRFGSGKAVVDILATLIDKQLGSCGEISEWVNGRMWRFEADDNLDARKRKYRHDTEIGRGAPEYFAKKTFMADLVKLMHDMGASELARQYEWWTCKSQPNAMKRLESDPAPTQGHIAVDFRAGLALLPFLPQSPGDFRLIFKGIWRGSLVQFDRGNLKKLLSFTAAHKDLFSDLAPALSELQKKDRAYRASLPDIAHHHIRILYDKVIWKSIKKSAISGWEIRKFIDSGTKNRLQGNPFLYALFYIFGLLPFLGTFLRRFFGHAGYRKHFIKELTSLHYFLRASRARIAENLIGWHRKGRVNAQKTAHLAAHPLIYYAHVPLSFLPAGLHRFLTDWAYTRKALSNIFVRPFRLYFLAHEREAWLKDMVSQGTNNGMLSSEEEKRILSRVGEPFIQKYLKSLAVHICTLPVTQIVSLIVAFVYVRLHPEFTWQQATMYAGLILGLFQITPISPGSLVRGFYVTYLVLREHNFKDYNIAFFLSYFKYIGYLAFPIQMAYRYPELARFMAGHWATSAVHIVPIFGERGALLEHAVFDLFYNYPLTIRHRIRLRREQRDSLRPRTWHIPFYMILGISLLSVIDLFYCHFIGHLPQFRSTWGLSLWIPFLFAALISAGAGGTALVRRTLYGMLSGTVLGLLYAVMNKTVLPLLIEGPRFFSPISIIRDTGLYSLWIMFLFTLIAVLGALFIETRPVSMQSRS